MLLTISTTHRPATDLGYLVHKHPGRVQSFDLSFGRAVVFASPKNFVTRPYAATAPKALGDLPHEPVTK
ncbi:MAG: hypothetical protein KF805_16370 [Phycisphaeraceae bacterium]|nr:hypothetical protein [Phycisphaeraceae bacterium]